MQENQRLHLKVRLLMIVKYSLKWLDPPTCGRVFGMGAGVKPRDVYGPSSSSQCSKWCQGDHLKEKEDFELCLKQIKDKRSIEKMELEGTINQLKEEMPLIIENVLKSMGLNSMPKPATQVCVCVCVCVCVYFQYNQN